VSEQRNILYKMLDTKYYCWSLGSKQKAKDLFCEVCSVGCKFHGKITYVKRKLGMLDWQP
jgi:hypothetical protein